MIVRTYGRRTRCDGRSFSDTSLLDSHGGGADDSNLRDLQISQDSCHDRRHGLASAFSSQESSPWSLDPDLFPSSIPGTEDPFASPLLSDGEGEARRTEKKGQNLKRRCGSELKSLKFAMAGSETSTLLEAQEFGEMMEHVDEVNFALDGLRPLQPARIRRASLLSLLTICSMAPRRRMLRARGMADIIIDAILGMNFDDSVSTVAAAALFFILASDVEDNVLLDSPHCIGFLLKLLNPPIHHSVMKKAPNLEIHKPQTLNSAIKGVDSSSRAIIYKVKEILLSCDEIRSGSEDDDGKKRPELSSKWIALLTMEKACFSTFSLEDTTEMARSIRGNFRESFRELKGLDAIFGVVSDCHSTLEGLLKKKSLTVSASLDSDSAALESVVFLLRCLKIMENATFMSKDNQNYLLSMKETSNSGGVPLSFVGIIINCIKFLSGLSLLQCTSSISSKGKLGCLSNGISALSTSHVCMKGENTDVQDSSTPYDGTKNSQMENIEVCHEHQKLFTTNLEVSTSDADVLPAMDRADCSASTSYDMSFQCSDGVSCTSTMGLEVNLCPNGNKPNSQRNSSGWISIRSIGSKVSSHGQSRRTKMSDIVKSDSAIDIYDPFSFDENNLGPSKWESLPSKKRKTQSCRRPVPVKEYVNGSEIPIVIIDDESSQPTNSEVILQSRDNSCPSVDEEGPSLLEDCLLSSVKVLMNLTNDNIVGCQQIGACGGLDTLASLIASNFPSFDLYVPIDIDAKESMTSFNKSNESGYLNDNRRLQGHELDFLVSILGLLVNLVEKDSINRLRLASACVLVNQPVTSSSKEIYRDVVPLLCGIFMSSQGAGNAIVEEKVYVYDEEASLSQSQREAEMMIIEAYTALLLAFLSTDSTTVKEDIARCLPNHGLQVLVPVLERFVAFHLTLNMISPETHAAVVKVIESCKEP